MEDEERGAGEGGVDPDARGDHPDGVYGQCSCRGGGARARDALATLTPQPTERFEDGRWDRALEAAAIERLVAQHHARDATPEARLALARSRLALARSRVARLPQRTKSLQPLIAHA